MKILITGGSGFIGCKLTEYFLKNRHRVMATGTRSNPRLIDHDNFRYISADTTQPGDWQEEIRSADVVVNLAGRPLFHRWTEKYKKQMRDSRILTTRNVVDALPEDGHLTLISTSAVGYYGNGDDRIFTEEAPAGDDFLARLSLDWEAEAQRAAVKKNVRVVIPRFGIVLDAGGGAMDIMIKAFNWFAGGKLGGGEQWFPWIHMADLAGAYGFFVENTSVRGPINLCSPHPVKNRELTRILAGALKRPALMPAPSFMMKLVMGELSQALLNSQRVIPKLLLEYGYTFKYPTLEQAIDEIIERREKILPEDQ